MIHHTILKPTMRQHLPLILVLLISTHDGENLVVVVFLDECCYAFWDYDEGLDVLAGSIKVLAGLVVAGAEFEAHECEHAFVFGGGEKGVALEALAEDVDGDLDFQLGWELLDEIMQPSTMQLIIILHILSYLFPQIIRQSIMTIQRLQKKQFILHSSRISIQKRENRRQTTRYHGEVEYAGNH